MIVLKYVRSVAILTFADGGLAVSTQPNQMGLVRELWLFMRETRAWWLAPIAAMLGLLGALAVVAETAGAAWPLSYPLF